MKKTVRQRLGSPLKDKKYLEKVKMLPCCACGASPPSDAHHAWGHEFGCGMGRKASDHDAIPLCKEHHQNGVEAFHNMKRWEWEDKYGTQLEHIENTRELVDEL